MDTLFCIFCWILGLKNALHPPRHPPRRLSLVLPPKSLMLLTRLYQPSMRVAMMAVTMALAQCGCFNSQWWTHAWSIERSGACWIGYMGFLRLCLISHVVVVLKIQDRAILGLIRLLEDFFNMFILEIKMYPITHSCFSFLDRTAQPNMAKLTGLLNQTWQNWRGCSTKLWLNWRDCSIWLNWQDCVSHLLDIAAGGTTTSSSPFFLVCPPSSFFCSQLTTP